MNPLTASLLVVATIGAIAALVLALAIVRAQEGYEDETGFHREMARVSVRPVKARMPASRPRKTATRNRSPVAEPVSVG